MARESAVHLFPPLIWLLGLPACVPADLATRPDRSVAPLESADTGGDIEGVPGADTSDLPPVEHPVWINEVCAANREALVDKDGDTPDWVELINPHDVALDLEGMGLSDDPDDPFAYVLSEGFLAPGEIRLIPASDKEGHAPFKLSAQGETLVLTGADGRLHDRVETGRLYFDQSLGRSAADGEWLYYLEPTPNAANLAEGRPGFAETPEILPEGVFHAGSVTVELATSSEAATVHYVVGASTPPSTESPVYAEPFDLSGSESTVVRAIAVEEGLWPSRVATRTFFLDREITLPVWSITVDPYDLFSSEGGIYSEHNIWEDWEVDAHLELYEDDGTRILETDAGLKLHGGASRTFDQKSLRLLFRSGYGMTPFVHPLFPDNPVTEFHRLVLRNGGHDDQYAELRDPLSHQLVRDLDIDVQAWRPTIVYLNGEYWGLYHTREKPDRHYVASHHGLDPGNLDMLEFDGWTVNEGDSDDYMALWDHVVFSEMSDEAEYALVEDWIDLEEYLLYQVIEIYSGNYDWPGNNIQFWRPRTEDGRWRWTLYDTEAGWYNWTDPSYDNIWHATVGGKVVWPYPNWSTSLFRNLLENRGFRDRFINTYADLLNTRFQRAETLPVFEGMVEQIAGEIETSQQRWGSSLSVWNGHVLRVQSWLTDRPAWARQHILDNFGLVGTWEISLEVDPPGSGTVTLEAITVGEAFEGTYFFGVPVKLTAHAAEGFSFTGWSLPVLGADPQATLEPDGDVVLVAEFAEAL